MQADFIFFILVALGGALGSLIREITMPLLPAAISWLPVLIINALGSFIIGIVYGLEESIHPRLKDFYAVGFCGGFSTFSDFTYQTFDLIQKGLILSALSNVLFSLLIVLFSVQAGLKFSNRFKLRTAQQ